VTEIRGDYLVTVCAECLCSSCWLGELVCWESLDADTTEMWASELDKLGKEDPGWYSRETLMKHGAWHGYAN